MGFLLMPRGTISSTEIVEKRVYLQDCHHPMSKGGQISCFGPWGIEKKALKDMTMFSHVPICIHLSSPLMLRYMGHSCLCLHSTMYHWVLVHRLEFLGATMIHEISNQNINTKKSIKIFKRRSLFQWLCLRHFKGGGFSASAEPLPSENQAPCRDHKLDPEKSLAPF